MKLFVGSSSLRGTIQRFGFEFLELAVGPTLARPRLLAQYRAARPDLTFSIRLTQAGATAGLDHDDTRRGVEAADACQARFIVLPTGPRFSPTSAHQAELKSLAGALRREGRSVVWEPRGVWGLAEGQRWANECGVLLARDLTQVPPPEGELLYTRVLQLGFGSRTSGGALELLAERVLRASEAYVLVDGDGAKAFRARLRGLFEGMSA